MAKLSPNEELLELHRTWFRASSAKDIEGAMAPIAADALSYEHETPLQYRGIGAIRAVCQHGFDLAEGEFTWDVPDLHIHVEGDLAVAWGLNRMHTVLPDGRETESWSRGTRVFRKIAGEWKMIHQHVSFPYDPSTGTVKTDLGPEL